MSLLPETLSDIADHLHQPREHVLSVWISAGHPGATLDTKLSIAERAQIFKLLMQTTSDFGHSEVTEIAATTGSDSATSPSATVADATSDLESTPVTPSDADDGPETPRIDDSYVLPTNPASDGLRVAVEKLRKCQDALRTTEKQLARVERERDDLIQQLEARNPSTPPPSQPNPTARIRELDDSLEEALREVRSLERELQKSTSKIDRTEATLKAREQELADAQAELAGSRSRNRELQRENKSLKSEAELLRSRTILDSAFPSSLVHDWITRRRRSSEFEIREGVVLLGDGPLDTDQIAGLVKRAGQPVLGTGSAYADVLVLGRENFFIEDIETQIRARSSKTLRIYSQEMFLAALLLNDDPFGSASKSTLKAFAEGHPGLELLLKFGFEWPSVNADLLGTTLFDADLEEVESPPHRMGYVVGVTKGLERSERRQILADAFSGAIPDVGNRKYMKAWGTPGSPTRLRRMANHLSWLVRMRRGLRSMETARAHWASDLEWLQDQYFEDWMRFRWPDCEVD